MIEKRSPCVPSQRSHSLVGLVERKPATSGASIEGRADFDDGQANQEPFVAVIRASQANEPVCSPLCDVELDGRAAVQEIGRHLNGDRR